jgi:hypothetical protein
MANSTALEAPAYRSLVTTGTQVSVTSHDKNLLAACYAGTTQLIEI